MATPDTSRFSWPGIDPAEWIRTWQAAWRGGREIGAADPAWLDTQH